MLFFFLFCFFSSYHPVSYRFPSDEITKRKWIIVTKRENFLPTANTRIHWNGKRKIGYVNDEYDMKTDSLPKAKDAFVFLLVALNSRWKLPIGYFFN
jgi:hypothetical protein